MSPEFLEAVSFTAEKARELGLRMDMTLCSGWPYGGAHVPISEASANLRIERVPVTGPGESVAIPNIIEGEKLIATFLIQNDAGTQAAPVEGRGRRAPALHISSYNPVAVDASRPRFTVPAGSKGNMLLFFISSRTGQQVKRAAAGAEGFVLNHYDRNAIETHLRIVGEPLMKAFGSHPPYAVFSDSLEVYAADWTPAFIDEFKKRRGYDLTPYLPALAGDIGDKTLAIRHDWAKTLTDLVDDNYLKPLNAWATQHGTRFRSQTYGLPPVTMSSNALVALPEGEGPQWRGLSSTRWATSASHLYNRPVTSSETWTWLHSPVFRATPLDMKAEADLHFLQGVNQLVGHGWPYSPPLAGEPGWRFYAAAVFNNHNPWWIVMPDITKYLQRVSFALRQGKPANDVAVYLATDDAQAHMANGQATINNYLSRAMNPEVIPQILDAGFNFDFIDDEAIAAAGIPFKVLVLPEVERISLAAYRKIDAFAKAGGIVIALRGAPSLAPGFKDDSEPIKQVSASLFEASGAKGHLLKDVASLGKQITSLTQPDFVVSTGNSAIGVVHRKLTDGDLYFVVNTSNKRIHGNATVRTSGPQPQWWDPMSGLAYRVDSTKLINGTGLELDLAPYESRILVFSSEPVAGAPPFPSSAGGQPVDLTTDWKVSIAGTTDSVAKLHSWTDDAATKYFSGQATYEKTVNIPTGMFQSRQIWLDFGPGTAVPDPHRTGPGYRALMEGPVRESALIYVNGQRAGSVWHPPYQIDVTKLVHTGANQFRIVVGNLAQNEMAGQAQPNYRLLNLRYGERFQAQDMDQVQPQPSGLVGPLQLVAR